MSSHRPSVIVFTDGVIWSHLVVSPPPLPVRFLVGVCPPFLSRAPLPVEHCLVLAVVPVTPRHPPF